MPLRFKHRILEHLAHDTYRPAAVRAIARDMRITPQERDAFEQAITNLAAEGRLTIGDDELVRLPSYGHLEAGEEEITGKFRLNARGFGFVLPEQAFREGDLFVPPGSSGGAVSGDRVRAKVVRASGRESFGKSPFFGRVIEVIERGQEHFVGTLHKRGRQWVVEPDGRSLHDPVVIRDPHAKNAKEGDKVVIELIQYPEEGFVAEGVIVNVLGEAGRPDVETQAVIAAHGLRTEFEKQVIDAARDASRTFEREANGPWKEREDLTRDFIFTIDPPDAKDFDDAISISHDEAKDEWTLGVHIADVSNFVKPGEALDDEAKQRGNSVYLPRLVIPMLPEVLSNGVCSLQEGVNRFTKSAFITLDGKGNVLHQRLANTVISSRKRLTYLEAQAVIDGNLDEARKHARTETEYSDELLDALKLSNRLARILEERRMRNGMIVLHLPEVELVFDDDGHVIDAVPEDDAYTHKLIEMFMVEANEAVARVFYDLGVPILRRIHPEPAHGDIQEMRMFAMAAGVRVPDEPTRRDLQRILEATKNTPAARAIHFAVLKTLAKASYSPALVGHFALASDHYAHFTSPIRRYPDLSLHRATDAYLDATDNGRNLPGGKKRRELGRRVLDDSRAADEGELIELGRHCSETEIEAELAERELREFLVLQFLHEKHLGDEFEGVITGVTSSGFWVSLDRFLVEGKVAFQEIPGADGRSDRWNVDQGTGRARAQRSGAVLAVGDVVMAQVVRIDLASRHLDLTITKMPQRRAHGDGESASEGRGGRRGERADRAGSRWGSSMKGRAKSKKHRKGFKQGRRGRRSR